MLDDYVSRFRTAGVYDRMFFVCHSPRGPLRLNGDRGVHLWAGADLADASLRAGLYDWLIERSA